MKDIKYDEAGDILIIAGDVVIDDGTYQNIEDVLIADIGWLKFDLVGVGLSRFINDDFQEYEVVTAVRVGLEDDGVSIQALSLNNGIQIEAAYKKQTRNVKPVSESGFSAIPIYHTVAERESIFDIAYKYYLNIDAAKRIVYLNDLSSLELEVGQVLKIDKYSVEPFGKMQTRARQLVTSEPYTEGVNFWAIETDFIIQ
jgi:hypothetical protein